MEDLTLLTLKEFARIIGKSYPTLKRWRRDGRLPDPVWHCGRRYWTVQLIAEWQRRPTGSLGIKRDNEPINTENR